MGSLERLRYGSSDRLGRGTVSIMFCNTGKDRHQGEDVHCSLSACVEEISDNTCTGQAILAAKAPPPNRHLIEEACCFGLGLFFIGFRRRGLFGGHRPVKAQESKRRFEIIL